MMWLKYGFTKKAKNYAINLIVKHRRKVAILIWLMIITALVYAYYEIEILGPARTNLEFLRRSRNLSVYLQPKVNTNIGDVIPPILCTLDKEVLILYMVTSSPANRKNRIAIRQTWGRYLNPEPIFFVGTTTNAVDMELLEEEAKLFKDIVIENFIDHYNNLTLKTGFMMKHFVHICPNARFIMKTDDDMFLNTNIIEDMLKMQPRHQSLMIGKKIRPYRPHRDPESKWYLPYWLYGESKFPSYLSGTGYIMSREALLEIYKAALIVPFIHIEDVMFTGIIANELLKIPLINDVRFNDGRPFITNYCLFRDLATAHHIMPSEMYRIWEGKLSKTNCLSIFRLAQNLFSRVIDSFYIDVHG